MGAEETKSGDSSRPLSETNPSKYFCIEARKAESELDYLNAAANYMKAYNAAVKQGQSSALYYKWYSMKCVEYHSIYERLLKKKVSEHSGRILSDGSIMALSVWDTNSIHKDIIAKYKAFMPTAASYVALIWNPKTEVMRYLNCRDFYTSNEPAIEHEYIVKSDGQVSRIESSSDPSIILHKWMLMSNQYKSAEKNAMIRRSIRIEYLNVPKFMPLMEFPKQKFFETYVEPAIGNRSVGKLEQKYEDYLVNLSCRNSSQGYYQDYGCWD